MADAKGIACLEKGADGEKPASAPEKRKFSEKCSPELPRKKMSFGFQSSKPKAEAPKIQMSLNGLSKQSVKKPIKMDLGGQKLKTPEAAPLKPTKKSQSVAQAFNQDDESDEEEMPFEAKMRMRNVGRETPTAAGPNSFGKGRMGFCDRRAALKKELEENMAKVSGD